MIKYSFYTLLALGLSMTTFAMSGKELLTRVQENYDKVASLELELDYNVYKGPVSLEVKENYTSLFKRDGKNSYRKLAHSEYIVEGDLMICINHDYRQITLTHAMENNTVESDLKDALDFCRDVRVREKEHGYKRIELVLESKSDLPYSRIEIDLDQSYWIEKITFYYNAQINFSGSYFNPEMGYPRLEVVYRNLNKNWKDETGLIRLDNYIRITPEKIEAASLYASYTIIDNRTKKL